VQKRQSGEPYYSHPLEVAYMFAEYTAEYDRKYFRTDLIITAILHDTIEDTTLTFERISRIFGHCVANQVMDLTRIKEDGSKISSADMVESLWREKKYGVLLIKQFDRLHNMQTIGAKSAEKIKKITDETMQTFLVLSTYFGQSSTEQVVENNLYQLCLKTLKEVTNPDQNTHESPTKATQSRNRK
jgi:(p)ppGpp synthase/HD superfamily hydrolase